VEAELNIDRGSIFDVNGQPLAITEESDGELSREYPLPSSAPAVGYYSIRYGTVGIEEAFDAYLRGESDDFWDNFWQIEVLNAPQTGRDIRLTIDSRWQALADSLLGDRRGAVILFSLPDVAIRAMASSPGYDPNSLESDFEQLSLDEQAPLLNRVTQGQYQPGLLLQPFLMAAALQQGIIDLEEPVEASDSVVVVNDVSLSCQSAVEAEAELSWAEALRARCPMVELGQHMGGDALSAALSAFGLTSEPDLPIVTEGPEETTIDELELAAIGQDRLAISPLQLAVALAALANQGELRPAQLVAARQDDAGNWVSSIPADTERAAVPADAAQAILDALNQDEGVLEYSLAVLSGPSGELNSWYLGLAPATAPRYGAIVVVEDDQGTDSASDVGHALLKSVLSPN
jgi:peptidoglycan glycosyltransferase